MAPPDVTRPGTFTYADAARLDHDLLQAGFAVAASEDVELDVMEATTDAELVAWTRAFGMNALLAPLPLEVQEHWERALVEAAAPYRHNGVVRLGGVTRVVVARKTA